MAGRATLVLAAGVLPVAAMAGEPPGLQAEDELPPTPEMVEKAIDDAVAWLVENQRETGAWGSHHSPRPIEVFCTPPGSHQAFRLGTTGLSIMALMDSGKDTEEVRNAIDRGIDYLLEDWNVKRMSGLEHYNVWAFGYVMQCFGERLAKFPDDPRADAMRAVCVALIDKLQRYQCTDGGWGYLSLHEVPTYKPSFTSMSFTTATIVVGLKRAADVGIEIPEKMLEKALKSIERCETPLGVYTYGELWNNNPATSINHPKGAACRTPACQYAIDLFRGNVTEEAYVEHLRGLLVKYKRFQIVGLRRPIPHESWYAISGYFYLYGHAYAAYVLAEELSEKQQKVLSPLMAEAVLITRQPDGSFWDYPLYSYHKPYGTAYALIALSRLTM